jgi:hypothetical protein
MKPLKLLRTSKLASEIAGALKHDQDKPRMELLPLTAVQEVAKVMTFGAEKYAAHGWKSLENAEERYTGALLRHLVKIQEGELIDPDSGLPHIAHVTCNSLFLTHFYLESTCGG